MRYIASIRLRYFVHFVTHSLTRQHSVILANTRIPNSDPLPTRQPRLPTLNYALCFLFMSTNWYRSFGGCSAFVSRRRMCPSKHIVVDGVLFGLRSSIAISTLYVCVSISHAGSASNPPNDVSWCEQFLNRGIYPYYYILYEYLAPLKRVSKWCHTQAVFWCNRNLTLNWPWFSIHFTTDIDSFCKRLPI